VAGNHADGGGARHGGGGLVITTSACCAVVEDIRIVDTTIRDNSTDADGGGLHTYGFELVHVERSLFVGNSANRGGGALIRSPSDFLNSTLSGNTAVLGGAIGLRDPLVCYAGTYCAQTSVRLRFSTLAENLADFEAFWSENPLGANALQMVGTILANDRNCMKTSHQPVDSLGSNIDTGTTCELAGPGDLSSTDPDLRSLEDNGGWTETHALDSGSPAIDAARPFACPRSDQRYAFRPAGDGCDIGAYEAGARFFALPFRLSNLGELLLALSSEGATALSKSGFTLGAKGPAEIAQDGLSFTEPIGDGWLGRNQSHFGGLGALLIGGANGSVELAAWDVQIRRPARFAHASLGNTQLPFLELSDTTLVFEGWTASGKAHALLSAEAAKALNKALGTKAFTQGLDLGVLRFEVDLEPPQGPPTPGDNPNG
jgi:hypothetical protein